MFYIWFLKNTDSSNNFDIFINHNYLKYNHDPLPMALSDCFDLRLLAVIQTHISRTWIYFFIIWNFYDFGNYLDLLQSNRKYISHCYQKLSWNSKSVVIALS